MSMSVTTAVRSPRYILVLVTVIYHHNGYLVLRNEGEFVFQMQSYEYCCTNVPGIIPGYPGTR